MGCHVAILFALLTAPVTVPVQSEPPIVTVSLVREPARTAAPVTAVRAAPAKAAPPKLAPVKARTPRPRAAPVTLDAGATASAASSTSGAGALLTGVALGSATGADALPGGACDMARRLQRALRRDGLVKAAVDARAPSGPGAILVWDGGWVANPGEDGKGLAAVREAIVWEVAFSPALCRQERVHGPVLFTVSEASRTRIAIGAGDWRWGDLVSSR